MSFLSHAKPNSEYLWGLTLTNNYIIVFIIYPVLGAVAATVVHAAFNEVFGNEKTKPQSLTIETKKDKESVNKEQTVAAPENAGVIISRKRSGSRSKK